eukprot:621859-Ditylum_brightwellii.AAC.1
MMIYSWVDTELREWVDGEGDKEGSSSGVGCVVSRLIKGVGFSSVSIAAMIASFERPLFEAILRRCC